MKEKTSWQSAQAHH